MTTNEGGKLTYKLWQWMCLIHNTLSILTETWCWDSRQRCSRGEWLEIEPSMLLAVCWQ